jgi:hypothetical protein
VKTIRGSTVIEGNALSEEQITSVPEGKHIVVSLKTKAGLKRCGASKNGEWHFEVLKFRGPDSGIWLSCCAIYG